MKELILTYFLIINAVGVIVMLADKRMAQKNLWRIPEATLLTVAVMGGGIGCLIGMYTFRHKTRHLTFTLGIPAILLAQLALAFYLTKS